MSDLNQVIEDSLTDVEITPDPIPDPTQQDVVEVVPEPAQAVPEPISEPEQVVPATDVKPLDDFEKKYGITAQSASGRENRIPYPRVKKIADKAAADAVAAKVKEYETSHTPLAKYKELEAKVNDYEPKIKDYESRLTQVAEFEHVMVNDHARFLQMLSGIPGYSQILAPLLNPPAPPTPIVDDMPQPDQELTDGSKVYTMEGLKALNAWNRAQAKKEVMGEMETRVKAMEKRYAPLETDYNRHQAAQAALPAVQRQIEEARKWPLFNESEDEIVKSLAENPNFSLERAYQTVVLPKLQTTRDTLRADILKEVKSAPRATSAPTSAVKSDPTPTGPRRLEDVIAESIKGLK